MIGNIWSNSDEDVVPAGKAAHGYQAITTHPAGIFADVQNEIIETVYGGGKGDLQDKSRLGSVYHNLGITAGIMHVEAIRNAQKRWGNVPLTAQQVRWGFENIHFDEARIKELGAEGLLAPMLVTCKDHVGGHNSKFQKYNAEKPVKWEIVTPWIKSQAPIDGLYASAEKYRADNEIEKRNCDDENDRNNWTLSGDQPAVPAGVSTWGS